MRSASLQSYDVRPHQSFDWLLVAIRMGIVAGVLAVTCPLFFMWLTG